MNAEDTKLLEHTVAHELHFGLAPPEMISSPDPRYWPEADDYTMSCSFDRTPQGRIWLAWFGGGDDDRAWIALAKSDDQGRTWSKPQFLLDGGYTPSGIHRSIVVGHLWTDPRGRLWLYFTMSVGYYDGRGGSWYTICDNPDSDKLEWSTPQRIWHGASLNKPTVLSTGEWMLPISLWRRDAISIILNKEEHFGHSPEYDDLYRELDPLRKAWVFVSVDQGRTWQRRGGNQNTAASFDEHMIIERKDGSLLMFSRDLEGMTEGESFDGGRTWSTFTRSLPSASARFFVRRLQSGKTLMVKYSNPETPAVRSHLTAYLSDDDCLTWHGGLVLDERMSVSYPDGFQAPDGRIFIQYDHNRKSDDPDNEFARNSKGSEILMAVFTEKDVAASKIVSDKAILKYPIMQSATANKNSGSISDRFAI